ncbi:Na+/H+ antiporter NhaA [Enemella sp. A6]|uniref:Na+/H+ antiporter NhaA n=1 Tax=Enemella sp. A6 TaxID=3440152 RepID=UPI003EB90B52
MSASRSRRRRIVLFPRPDHQDAIAISDVLRMETFGGIFMLAAAVAGLVWANLHTASYRSVQQIGIGPLDLQHWAADGLLAIFFFVAGMELKRELTAGSLRRPAQAMVPIAAAIGGMIVPALLYLAINLTMPGGRVEGWAIPMATDIAFALTVLALAGPRLPAGLRAFLLTLAIVDDIGAIAVIAVVFTSSLAWLWLGGALACAAAWYVLQRLRIDLWPIYVVLFLITWWCMFSSGVHATITGVLLGLLTRTSADESLDPIDRWEHFWRPISSSIAVPIFALMSAGVVVTGPALQRIVTEPVALGIIAGLLLGKVLGISGAAWLTARLTSATLPEGLRWTDVFAVAMLGGIGFTVALLVAELSFPGEAELLDAAKAAVLLGSLLSALIAALMLHRRRPSQVPSWEDGSPE